MLATESSIFQFFGVSLQPKEGIISMSWSSET
jgi:hypothetical protein